MLFRRGYVDKTLVLLVVLWVMSFLSTSRAQTTDDTQQLKQKISELIKQQKYVQLLPLLEKMASIEPNDPDTHFHLGFALMAQANISQNADERKTLRVRARQEFIKAKDLGEKAPVVDALIPSLAADGSDGPAFSANKEANDLMAQAEGFFSEGKLDDALLYYQNSLLLDPKLYEAALYSGDVYAQKQDWTQSEIWYQKAIAINPDKEIGYRYSATPFMRQGKYDVARDRYVEAYITEPYSRFSKAGLQQWSIATKSQLGSPNIDIPAHVKLDENGNAKVDLDVNLVNSGRNDGSFAWVVYAGTRSLWHKEKFIKMFPAEKTYRHSLDEEADALRNVIHAAMADKKLEKLSPSLAKLKELDDRGFLESYILLVRADDGIAADYPRYLSQNREKLRQYVVEYVLTSGGK